MTQDEKFPNKNEIKKVLENMNIKFLYVHIYGEVLRYKPMMPTMVPLVSVLTIVAISRQEIRMKRRRK